MSPTSTTGQNSVQEKEAQELNLLERIEFGSKITAGVLALTYVSGYLVATTYLATYGIPADASELFRAKYIYIGCQYWMFVTVFGVIARAVVVVFDSTKEKRWSLKHKVKVIETFGKNDADVKSHLRWVLVVGLILATFAFEIMLLTPGNFTIYLPLQAILLLSIALYQVTFYREYREPYTWGRIYGRRRTIRMRWLYGFWIGALTVILMAILAIFRILQTPGSEHIPLDGGISLTLRTIVSATMGWGAFYTTLSPRNLVRFTWRRPWLPMRRSDVRLALSQLRHSRLMSIVFPAVVIWYSWVAMKVLLTMPLNHSRLWIGILYYGTLISSLSVLGRLCTSSATLL